MDYSLAALKLLCVQLKSASETPSQSAMTLGGILFQRAWLQGILISSDDGGGGGGFLLDDGTGVIELSLAREFHNRHWNIGTYVMVVGGYFVRTGELPMIKGISIGGSLVIVEGTWPSLKQVRARDIGDLASISLS